MGACGSTRGYHGQRSTAAGLNPFATRSIRLNFLYSFTIPPLYHSGAYLYNYNKNKEIVYIVIQYEKFSPIERVGLGEKNRL